MKESRTVDGRRASAGEGRRTGEERRTPGAQRGAFDADGSGRSDLNQDDDSGGCRDGDDGVENDAEGAVVGVGFEGVGVSHLDEGEQGQKHEAEDRRRHRGTGLDEDGLPSSLLEFVQGFVSTTRIHRIGRVVGWSGCEARLLRGEGRRDQGRRDSPGDDGLSRLSSKM